jgi:hypothetical protein
VENAAAAGGAPPPPWHRSPRRPAGRRSRCRRSSCCCARRNARLKAAGHQEPDLGALLDRARSLPAGGAGADDRADEAAQLLVEGMVMRESLLGLCQEIGRSMAALEARLAALGGATVAAGEGA